jgi:hypothetical protein
MTLHVPRLPFALDPLVAEAKRRARRRRAALLALAIAAVAIAVTFGLRVLQSPVGAATASHGPLSGSWHGTSWRLHVASSGDGRYGLRVLIAGSQVASRSGHLYVRGPGRVMTRLGWTSKAQGRLPFVAGAVPITPCCEQSHAEVTVRLSDGSVKTTRATVPPYSLTHAPGIAFFLLPTPRGGHPTAITARNAAGHTIAAWKRAH